jgi:sugar phosphate isomerase/epimerase
MNLRFLLSLLVSTLAVHAAQPGPRLTISAYTFHTFTVFEAVEKTAQCGARHLETFTNQSLSPTDPTKIYALSDAQRDLLRVHLAKHGIEIVSCMGAVPKDEAKARAFFDTAKKLGAKNIGTDSVDSIDTIQKIIGDYDLTVAFHNHAGDPKKPEYRNSDPVFMRDLLTNRHPRIGVCADTGHYATSGVVPLDAIKLLAGRVLSVHLKERSAIGTRTPDQVYGTGVSRLADILAELRRQNFSGPVVIEYETNPRNNLAEVKQCMDFLKKNLSASATPP